jgi:hypothetical protein
VLEEEVYLELGYDYRFQTLSTSTKEALGYSYVKEISFRSQVSAEVLVFWAKKEGLTVQCRPSWASYNGPTLEAISAARLHLETALKCADVECAMREILVKNLAGNSDKDAKVFKAGVALFVSRIKRESEKVRQKITLFERKQGITIK